MSQLLSSEKTTSLDLKIHPGFIQSREAPDPEFGALLSRRRQALSARIEEAIQRSRSFGSDHETIAWLTRSYPVLAIHAPVMTTQEGKIEYPGDPMSLYSALSVAVDEAVKARQAGLRPEDPYNDLCPRWGELPSDKYRMMVDDGGVRDYFFSLANTDQSVYAPGVWNEEVKAYFVPHVLKVLEPHVVLISAVSPGHRYALDIARMVRRELPSALIVLGGPHADETMQYHDETGDLDLQYSSTLQAMAYGRAEPVIDFVISGDGYWALDRLMKAISLAMDLESKTATVAGVVQALEALAHHAERTPGQAVIAASDGRRVHIFPMRGGPVDLGALPSPYRAFAVRARFPIFRAPGGWVQRTAHIMASSACPYHCSYCSESSRVTGAIQKFSRDSVRAALDRLLEYVSYGAEALFFDDSIFWAGNVRQMVEFCQALSAARATARGEAAEGERDLHWLHEAADRQRLAELQWGAQLTVEFLTSLQSREKAIELLHAMRDAGCTYIYFGIESMARSVMAHIHKNLAREDGPAWPQKVRAALEMVEEAGIRAGASILFGLEGETRETIDETIEGIAALVDDGLLDIASPNILTYHPGTAITVEHKVQDRLDYHSLDAEVRPPYCYFEEAFPNVVSKTLSESDIWAIYEQTRQCWSREEQIEAYAERASFWPCPDEPGDVPTLLPTHPEFVPVSPSRARK